MFMLRLRLYVFLIIGFALSVLAPEGLAQCDADEQYDAPGLYPEVLPDGEQDAAYDPTALTFVFPEDTLVKVDTTIFGAPLNFDLEITFSEFVVDSAGGLPAGMAFDLRSCNLQDCRYELPENNSGCLQFEGTPTESGGFSPFIRAVADGTFPMPELNLPIPGLPEPGTEIQLSDPPQLLAPFVLQLRRNLFAAALTITGDPEPSCSPELSGAPAGLYPAPLAAGKVDSLYPETTLTQVFPLDTTITATNFAGEDTLETQLTIVYSEFQILEVSGLPQGINADLATCNRPECLYALAEDTTACFAIRGTPEEEGVFTPAARLRAEGVFIMPELSAEWGDDLPEPGAEVPISEAPDVFAEALAGIIALQYSTELTITRDTLPSGDCVPETQIGETKGVYPNPLPEGEQNTAYEEINVTFVMPLEDSTRVETTIVIFPLEFTLNVQYSSMRIVDYGGLPDGMAFDLGACNAPGCGYDLLNGGNRGCLPVSGAPTEFGAFEPFILAEADGFFIVPQELGAVPGLPDPGTRVNFEDAPELLEPFLEPLINVRMRTRLLISPEGGGDFCVPDLQYEGTGLYPEALEDGKVGQEYQRTTFTAVLLSDTTIEFGADQGLPIDIRIDLNIEEVVFSGAEDVPPGMTIDLETCNRPECIYDPRQSRYACIDMYGTPTEPGEYEPAILAEADGWFLMPNIPFPIPGLPEEGDTIRLSNPPDIMAEIVEVFRTIPLASNLRIEPDAWTELCHPEVAATSGTMHPEELPPADSAETYGPAEMTLDLPTDTVVFAETEQGELDVPVFFSAFTVEETIGLPEGLSLEGVCADGIPCDFVLNNLDTARNRICFTLQGATEQVGTYEVGLRLRAEGEALFFGGAVDIWELPSEMQVEVAEAIRTQRTMELTAQLEVRGEGTGRGDLSAVRRLKLYPNPTDGQFALDFYLKESAVLNAALFDAQGREVRRATTDRLPAGDQTLTLDLAKGLAPGVYALRLEAGGGVVTQTIMVQN